MAVRTSGPLTSFAWSIGPTSTGRAERGGEWRSAVEVELVANGLGRTTEILRGLLDAYDGIVYFATPRAARVVTTAGEAVGAGRRLRVRPYPPTSLAEVA